MLFKQKTAEILVLYTYLIHEEDSNLSCVISYYVIIDKRAGSPHCKRLPPPIDNHNTRRFTSLLKQRRLNRDRDYGGKRALDSFVHRTKINESVVLLWSNRPIYPTTNEDLLVKPCSY